ncbi:hypothetical protein ZIOFF_019631 [Zingiber officinale]|uniref:PHD finger protein ALFIN-LIKE n=1 Tax=Zingiber officinale TaxID=94328 RepID=A0A8J5HEI0_ZINOF|nr:hypothetical protein ZIOFF_019631 [Zingiber officinale]
MDRGSAAQNSRLVEEVFRDIKGRRAAIIRALTTAKENLCLYGYPDEQWEVNLPAEEVPPEIPEPVLGINFARDGMEKKSWLSLVALHSDAWLLALSSYFSGRFQFEKKHRKLLLDMITDLPTICEVVNGKNQDKTSGSKLNNNKSKSNSKLSSGYADKIAVNSEATKQPNNCPLEVLLPHKGYRNVFTPS